MKRITLIICTLLLVSCGGSKVVTKKRNATNPHAPSTASTKTSTKRSSSTRTNPKPKTKIKETPEVYANATEEYIAIYSDKAQDEMRDHGIPASITLAQGILESGSGKGRLAKEGNNHFGIKCHDWKGKKIYHDDDKKQECFRKYGNSLRSFDDHSAFLTGRSRYAKLFTLSQSDYQGWAKELRKAGYATDRRYPQKLISLIERYQLYRFDAEVLGQTVNNDKHTVVKGDTLYSLSKKYKISVAELKSLNGIEGNEVFIGQVLFVKPLPED